MNDGDPPDPEAPSLIRAPHRPGGSVHRGMVALLQTELRWLIEHLVRRKVLPPDLNIELVPTEMWAADVENHFRELRPDLVARLWPGPIPDEPTLHEVKTLGAIGLDIEIQTCRDERKRDRWPEMVLACRRVLGRDIIKVVFTFERDVAEWALRILQPTRIYQRIIVITPDKVPRLQGIDPRQRPRRALLAAMLHGKRERSLALLADALRALRWIEDEELVIYREMLLAHMGEKRIMAAYEQLEPGETENWDDYVPTRQERESFLYVRGHRKGQEEGEVIGRARAVIDLLRARGLEPSESLESTILACRDPERLQAWLTRALSIDHADALLD